MTTEQRRDIDLVLVSDSSGTAERGDRADANDAHDARLQVLREYLQRPIKAWQLDWRTPFRPEVGRGIFRKEVPSE